MSTRLERAVAAFRREEFGSSIAAVIGFIDILVEDAVRQGHTDLVSDLERMRVAGGQLTALIAQAVDLSPREAGEIAQLRHELRADEPAAADYYDSHGALLGLCQRSRDHVAAEAWDPCCCCSANRQP